MFCATGAKNQFPAGMSAFVRQLLIQMTFGRLRVAQPSCSTKNLGNDMNMTPNEFIQSAYAEVQALTDESDQMHRRAVRGKPLVVHLHGWDKTARERPAPGGMTELQGGRAVTLRVQGQYVDRGFRVTCDSTEAAQKFADAVSAALDSMKPPVPA